MSIRAPLLRLYWAMRRVIAPTLRYSQYPYEEILAAHVRRDTRWLDLGCGHHVLPPWRGEQERRLVATCRSLVGLDADLVSLARHRSIDRRVGGDMTRLPFADASFDLVTANMV